MKNKPDIETVLSYFCDKFNVDVNNLKGRSRKQEICYYRHGFCAFAKSQGFTLKEIGQVIDNRDHTTVINSVEKHFQLVNDKQYRKLLNIRKPSWAMNTTTTTA